MIGQIGGDMTNELLQSFINKTNFSNMNSSAIQSGSEADGTSSSSSFDDIIDSLGQSDNTQSTEKTSQSNSSEEAQKSQGSGGGGGESSESTDPMDLNQDGTVTLSEMLQYLGLQSQGEDQTASAGDGGVEDSSSFADSIKDFGRKVAAQAYQSGSELLQNISEQGADLMQNLSESFSSMA